MKAEIHEVKYILNDTIKGCRIKFFPSFEYSCVYDIKFISLEKTKKLFYYLFFWYMKLKNQFYGLCKRVQKEETMASLLLKLLI